MSIRTTIAVVIASAICLGGATVSLAHEGPEERREQRQEKRDDRREARQDRRADRQDARQDRRDNRREARQDRQEKRQDARQDRRANRQDARQDRRENRREARQDRREHRQDARQDRREHRQDMRQDRREHRQEARQDRREHRQEMRQDRREHRRELWNNRISRFDMDGNGELSPQERSRARDASRSVRKKLRRHIDKDNDGIISDMEWKAFSKDFGETDDDRHDRFTRIKQRFDSNSNGSLDKDERGLAMRELHARRIDMLEHFDANEDGRLDKDERQRIKDFHKQRAEQRKLDRSPM